MVGIPARHWQHSRLTAAGAVGLLHLLVGYALVNAFGIALPVPAADSAIKLFDVLPPPVVRPPPPPAPVDTETPRPKRPPAPPNLKATPSPVVAPPPELPLLTPPPPIVAAPAPGTGAASSAGAAAVAGPGTGADGVGDGSGGGGDGGYSPPRWLRGEVKGSDYPRAAGAAGLGTTMTVRFTVEPSGRVSGCEAIESSDNPLLDEATCRAIERRYRYEPSRDAEGRPVPSMVVESHTWSRDQSVR